MKNRFKPKFNINWKQVSRIGIWSLLVFGFIISVGFTSHKQHTMPCKSFDISINDSMAYSFVEYSDIVQVINDKFGGLTGRPMNEINIALLEKIINNNPFVLNAEVFSTLDGIVKIEVVQRKPILRVFNYNNESFYIDNAGKYMPTSPKYTARVPVANGAIAARESDSLTFAGSMSLESSDTSFHPTTMQSVYMLAKYINKDDFWNAQIEQLYVNETGDIELIPRVGNQKIIFGDASQVKEKFNKLFVLYTKGFDKTGWNNYSTINLKFNDQVVCTKIK